MCATPFCAYDENNHDDNGNPRRKSPATATSWATRAGLIFSASEPVDDRGRHRLDLGQKQERLCV